MATLVRRVQVLFEPQQYTSLQRLAESEGKSVAAVIRDTVDHRLSSRRTARRAVAEQLIAGARQQSQEPMPDWADVKANFERAHLAGIE